MCEQNKKLREISNDELQVILEEHKKWLDSDGLEGKRANLSQTNLSKKSLGKVNLRGADLERADLYRTHLEGADLIEVNLEGANLRGANFEKTDLRYVIGLELDSNFVQNTRFSYKAKDKWSTLRRAYSGPMFFSHLIFLLLFITPYIIKTGFWYTVSQAEKSIQQNVEILDTLLVKYSENLPENERKVVTGLTDKIQEHTSKIVPKKENGWRDYMLWQVLLGHDLGIWYLITAVIIILYNIGRGFLTWRVGAIRDEEERSKFSPAKNDYLTLFKIHKIIFFFCVVSLLSFAFHVYGWLSTEVLLPPIG